MSLIHWSPDLLIDIGFTATAIAFLLRNILWLRLLAVLSYSLFCTVALIREEGPIWHLVSWYAVFMVINLGHAGYLFYESSLMRLTDEESRLRNLAFRTLDRVAVKRLFRTGQWLTLAPGALLARQGQVSKFIYVIASGEVAVTVGDSPAATLPAGWFVGEISFLADQPATATVAVTSAEDTSNLRCLAWDQRKLRKRVARDPAVRAVVYSALGADLSAKIADHNIKVTRPVTPEFARSATPE